MQVNTRKLHLVGFRPCGLAKFSSAPRCVQFSPLSIASAAARRTNLTGNRRPANTFRCGRLCYPSYVVPELCKVDTLLLQLNVAVCHSAKVEKIVQQTLHQLHL